MSLVTRVEIPVSAQKGVLLTILILTHNRPEKCNQLVQKLSEFGGHVASFIEIIVIDDSGPEFRGAIKNSNLIKLITHDCNIGFKKSLLEGASKATGNYILYLADDDDVNLQGIIDLLVYCNDNYTDFYSTKFYFNSGGGRGLNKSASAISPREFLDASFHAPGLVFKKQAIARILNSPELLPVFNSYYADLFPQVVLVLIMFKMNMNVRWLNIEISIENQPCPSNLRDSDGRTYKDPLSRLRQVDSLCQIVDALFQERSNQATQIKYYCLRKSHNDFRDNFHAVFPKSRLILANHFCYLTKIIIRFPREFLLAAYLARSRKIRVLWQSII
jgi:hypothetical protein